MHLMSGVMVDLVAVILSGLRPHAFVLVVCCAAAQHTTRTHSPRDRLLTTPRTYAAFVKKLYLYLLLKMGV